MHQARFHIVLLVLIVLVLTTPAVSAGVVVHDQDEYEKAVKHAKPGDVIQLANGIWNDFEILFRGQGTEDEPITLTAQEKGKVIISGQSNLRIAGQYLVVSGLVFRDGYTPTSEVISFQRNKEDLASHSRVTELVIDGFNNPERTETDYWVVMYGRHNRFDHNHVAGKSNNGVTMAVKLNSEASQENHHRIDHNYFGQRPNLGSNGGETLRIGTSHYSLSNSFTSVENNFFERCNGEVEIISVKSGNNVIRGNAFLESRGTLTLRHGNDNLVENNVFFGHGVDHTGGIRLINKRQTIRNNYLQGLTGYRFGSALTIMNGVPDSPINRYHQVIGQIWALVISWRKNKKIPVFVYASGLLLVAVEISIRVWDPPYWSQQMRADTLYNLGLVVMAVGAFWASVVCLIARKFWPPALFFASLLIIVSLFVLP